ncbi:DUF3575 domain-containing protein [Parabacteroides sp. PF5-6]|uniref:DUF3575 domain-containing protein n=1 Tax=Parabacteroides sp. PF5-6 TaxID=1742403 RepID=UPI0024067028|nr:DUF3575 domain-containing protein [Parabacteroides sp. PF5-6]MDF9830676.1 outer membrane protein OmpA-like peptidoglycan-associated protein [Parabacteroides sp. PF5-6]
MSILRKKYSKQWVVICALLLTITEARAQSLENTKVATPAVGIKTNLLYDATSSMNLGVEFRTGNRTSFDLSGNWNPWTFSNNRKWKHILVQPEFRWWTKETFHGHFFGLHAHYAFYNVSRLPKAIFSDNMANHRYQGWLAGAGISYGYRWNFNTNWSMEASIGVGYAYLDYKKYECGNCGERIGTDTKNYFGPTKAGITLIYTLGGKKKQAQQSTPPYIPAIIQKEPEPEIAVEVESNPEPIYLPPVKFQMEILSEKYPFVLPVTEFDPNQPVRYYGDERDNALTVYFRLNHSSIESEFSGNDATLTALLDAVNTINNSEEAEISHIVIAGFSSPEGSTARNEQLAGERATAVRDYLLAHTTTKKGTVLLHNGAADWQGLRKSVAADPNVPNQQEVLNLIDNSPVWNNRTQTGRQTQLRKLNGGRTWEYLKKNIFPELRNGTFIRVYWNLTNTINPNNSNE